VRLTSDQPNEIYIVFHPAGSPPVVAEVSFRGNKVFPAMDLQLAIHSSAIGIEYREARFRDVLDHTIRPLYEQRGYIRVAFPKLEATPSEGVKGLKVTVEIAEGETYSFGELRVEGTESLNQELAKIAGIKSGELANMDLVMAAEEKIKAAMKRSGYMKVATKVDREVDQAEREVDLMVQVTPGPQYKFGSLDIQGLGIHGVHELKRIWTLEPGRVFNAEYPDYFLNRIREDGIFDNLGKTKSVVKLNDQDLTVAVTLIFEGTQSPEEKKLPR
jgi:outer membrane protein insertion porin family